MPDPAVTWAPTVQDIADRCPEYTRQKIDQAGPGAGARRTFTEHTVPTAQVVEGHIATAVREVTGRVLAATTGVTSLEEWGDLAREAAAWHAARSVEADKRPASVAEAEGGYSWKQSSYVACLNDLIAAAKRVPPAVD